MSSEPNDLASARRRNTLVLAVGLALTWSVVQLAAGFAAIILSDLVSRRALAGLAPALFLGGWATAGPPAGRFMDRRGRRSGIVMGFAVGAAASSLLWIATSRRFIMGFLVGITLIGMACGWLNLGARAGATDMYPPEKRARGLSFVLVGAAIGAIIAPLLFGSLLARTSQDASALAVPWLLAAAIMVGGAVLTLAIRRDPIEFSTEGSKVVQRACVEAGPLTDPVAGVTTPWQGNPRPLRDLTRSPGVAGALLAVIVVQTVMSGTMTVIGVAIHDHSHQLRDVSLAVSMHFLGMFAFVLVVGFLVDRFGRVRSIVAGLIVAGAGAATLAGGAGFITLLPAMFALGVGWNIAFVAATALMADATEAHERGRLLGFGDFLAAGTAAGGTIGAGVLLDWGGLKALAVVGGILAVLPIALMVGRASKLSALVIQPAGDGR